MADIVKIAEQLNSDVTRLNNERSKKEGMLESAKTRYENAIREYENKYGVKLTAENLQAEYNKVFAEVKGNVLDLQEQIESIKRGDYKKEDTQVIFDLEPNVEPIRAKVETEIKVDEPDEIPMVEDKAEEIAVEEPKPTTKKRGRPPKVKVSTEEKEPEIPASGPLDLNLDFTENTEETVVTGGNFAVEEKVEKKKIIDNLDELLAETEVAVQNPITLGIEDEDVDTSFGTNPKSTDEVAIEGLGDLGGFTGLGDFGITDTEEVVEEKPVEDASNEDFSGFGDLEGFAGFGGFGAGAIETQTENIQTQEETPTQDDNSDVLAGWGSDSGFNFNNIDFDSIMNGGNVKFGE